MFPLHRRSFALSYRPTTTVSFIATVALAACGQGGGAAPPAGNSTGSSTSSTATSGTTGSSTTSGGSGVSSASSRGTATGTSTGTSTSTSTSSGTTNSSSCPSTSDAGSSTSSSSSTGPYTWKNVALGAGGFVSGLVFSPAQCGLLYARTDVGGFYRWDNANTQWIPLVDSFSAAQGNYFGGKSIAPDPTDPSIVYAAAGMYLGSGNGAILRSTNQGATWTVNPIPVAMGGNAGGRGMGERLAIDPNNHAILLFGSRNNGLYKSSDSGSTWAPVAGFPTMGDATYGLPVVVFDKTSGSATGSKTIYVAAATLSAGTNLYRSTDGGTTWAVVAGGGPTGLMVHHAALASDGTLWLAYSSDYGPYNIGGNTLSGQVWKLAAGTWTNVTPPSANWGGMAGGISVDAQNPKHAIVSTLDWYTPDRLLQTTDGGTTWSVVGQPPVSWISTPVSTYDVNGVLFWTVGGGLVSTGGTNWVEAVALDPFNSSRAMYGTGAGVWTSTNLQAGTGSGGAGVTWTFLDKGLEETVPIYLMPSISGAFLGAIGDLGGMRNANLDTYSTSGEYANPIYNDTDAIDFAESNPSFVVRVGHSGTAAPTDGGTTGGADNVAYSSDNGQTWSPCATPLPGYAATYSANQNQMQSVAVSADGTSFVVSPAAGYGNPAVTADKGMTWTASTGLPTGGGAMLASDRVTAGTYYATSGSTLYVSKDGGKTFAMANTFTGTGAPRSVFGEAGEVWVAASVSGTPGNLYRFTAYGATLAQVMTVTSVTGVGFGKAATGQTHPAVYIIGTVSGQYGFFRSDDGAGASWTRVNDDQHQYGWLQENFIAGDESVYGRVYVTTGGRGYVYGDPAP